MTPIVSSSLTSDGLSERDFLVPTNNFLKSFDDGHTDGIAKK